MRIDSIQSDSGDSIATDLKIQKLSSTPETQLHSVEADQSVLPGNAVESDPASTTSDHEQRRRELSFAGHGRMVIRELADESGEVVSQIPTDQVLQVAEEIDKQVEEEQRRLDLRS